MVYAFYALKLSYFYQKLNNLKDILKNKLPVSLHYQPIFLS